MTGVPGDPGPQRGRPDKRQADGSRNRESSKLKQFRQGGPENSATSDNESNKMNIDEQNDTTQKSTGAIKKTTRSATNATQITSDTNTALNTTVAAATVNNPSIGNEITTAGAQMTTEGVTNSQMELAKQIDGNKEVTITKPQVNYQYEQSHKGPYMVYVDVICNTGERKPINALSLGRIINKLQVKDVNEIIKIGYGRCKVTFVNHITANNFVNDKRIEAEGYQPKIFAHFVSKVGIIFDIPTEITMDELMTSMRSTVPVLKCIRMERRERNEDRTTVPTRRVKIIFKGLEIPKEIFFEYTRIPVRHFISFSQCYRCFRYNHFAEHCKQRTAPCTKCFQLHEKADECRETKCSNCKQAHPPTSRECPAREKAYAIKRTMTIENLSFKEASMKFRGVFSNRFDLLADNEQITFPAIKSKMDKIPTINNSKESAEYIHSRFSYSQAARTNPNREREARKSRESMEEYNELIRDSNVIDNRPKKLTLNPHKTSPAERLNAEVLKAKTNEENSVFRLKSIEAENTLVEIKGKLNEFMINWSQNNLSSEQREELDRIRSKIDLKLVSLDTIEISRNNPKMFL